MSLSKFFAAFTLAALYLMSTTPAAAAPLIKANSKQDKINMFYLDLKGFDSLDRALEVKNNKCMEEEENAEYRNCTQEIFEVILGRRSQDDGTRTRLYATQLKRMVEADRNIVFGRLIEDNAERLKTSGLSSENRATSLEVLVNLAKELDPRKTEEREFLIQLEAKKIEIPEEVERVRTARMGLKTKSPSLIASELLEKTKESVKETKLAKADASKVDEVLKSQKDHEQPAQGMEPLDLGY